jgi:hypothetical protein
MSDMVSTNTERMGKRMVRIFGFKQIFCTDSKHGLKKICFNPKIRIIRFPIRSTFFAKNIE